MKIYVASSWRNSIHPEVVTALRDSGHTVYDFKNPVPDTGFKWSKIGLTAPDGEKLEVNAEDYDGLIFSHPTAVEGFMSDFSAMNRADVCVLVLPCGRSAHTEAGFMAGQGKPVFIFQTMPQEPELMYRIYNAVIGNMPELLARVTTEQISLDRRTGRTGEGLPNSIGFEGCSACGGTHSGLEIFARGIDPFVICPTTNRQVFVTLTTPVAPLDSHAGRMAIADALHGPDNPAPAYTGPCMGGDCPLMECHAGTCCKDREDRRAMREDVAGLNSRRGGDEWIGDELARTSGGLG